MSNPSEESDRKPDGSAYEAHMEKLRERNEAAKKAGKADRKKREDAADRDRNKLSAKMDANLRRASGHAPPRKRSTGS